MTLLCLVIGLATAGARADDGGEIVIERVEWGFDGRAVPQTFVPLSILVRNHSPSPASGTLTLIKTVQLTQQVDAAYQQDYFVSGSSSRWVQITPYVIDDFENWSLRWGPGRDQSMSVSTPRTGDPATVLVVDPNIVTGRGGALRRIDPMRFPASITGTDALRGVVFDRPPEWQGARELAFLEWLKRGGRVYLILNENGVYPNFSGDLDLLNRQRDRFFVGNGVVRRIPLRAAEIDARTAETQILKDDAVITNKPETGYFGVSPFGGVMSWDRNRDLFDGLREAVSFHRRWWLIYGGVLLYLIALYPGCYVVGRRATHWRNFYAAFLGASIGFSLLFAEIGRVGGGETNRIRTAAIAYEIDDGLYDVTGWSCLAAVNGDTYDVAHGGSGRLYSTCQQLERVNGAIHLDAGVFHVEMPPASTRTLLHRVRTQGPRLGIEIREFQRDEAGLSRLTLALGDESPRNAVLAYLWEGNRIYELTASGDDLILANRGTDGLRFLTAVDYRRNWQMTWGALWGTPMAVEPEVLAEDELFEAMHRSLIGNSFGVGGRVDVESTILPDHLIRVLLYAPMGTEFHARSDAFPDQRGYVLYVVDLPVPEATE